MDRHAAIADGLAEVLERPASDFAADLTLNAAGVDSIALVVLADVIEADHPGWTIPNDVLRFAETIADLAEGMAPIQ